MQQPIHTHYKTTFSGAGERSRPFLSFKRVKGLTLIEILIAVFIIGLLLALQLPALNKVRYNSRLVRGMNNQRQIVELVGCYALDNNERYPESVATIGILGEQWNWQEPTMMAAYQSRNPDIYRSLSAYMYAYVQDSSILYCANAPRKYKYLQQAWGAGEEWDNPETVFSQDPVIGTYCFYWNYVGFLGEGETIFKGPRVLSGEGRRSKLLVSDYFGYGHWRNKLRYNSYRAYGSCEKFKRALVTRGTAVSSDFWSRKADEENSDLDTIKIKLHAGFTDGHVERYSASDVVAMRVSKTADGKVPYPDELGPGIFYLPKNAVKSAR